MSEEHERTPEQRRPRGTFKAVSVCFTYNNPSISAEDLWSILRANGAGYGVFQLEEGAREGTPHFQGYAHFGDQRRFGPRFRDQFPSTIWLSAARGSAAKNRAYCTKEETRKEGPWEFGDLPAGQGARSDLAEFYEAVRSGRRAHELIDDHYGIIARYPRFYHTILSLRMPTLRNEAPRVTLSFGGTGVGKTREVMERFAGNSQHSFFRAPLGGGFWMDGYDGHDVVLLDDFAGAASKITLVFLLQILDRYPVQVPVKGSFVWWYPKEIHITTNIHPWQWYDFSSRLEQYSALMRRIAFIKKDLIQLDEVQRADFTEWRPPVPQIPEYPNLPPYNAQMRVRRSR